MSSWFAGLVPAGGDNISVLALPAYWLLCLAPHAVAIAIASGGRPLQRWDNRNPRSGDMKAALRKRLGDARYATYERAEAAHYNSLESFPLVAAAVAFANLARLPAPQLNAYVLGMLALRALHQLVYIRTSTQGQTFARTLVWYVQVGWSLRLLWRAGAALA